MSNRRLHDGIVGGIVLVTTILGSTVSTSWLIVPIVIGALLLLSMFTGFCPVYFTLGILRPSK